MHDKNISALTKMNRNNTILDVNKKIETAQYQPLYKKYCEDGYCILSFPDKEFSQLAEDIMNEHFSQGEIEDWRKYKANAGIGLRIQDSPHPAAQRIAQNETILKLLTDFYGKVAFPFQTLIFPVGTQQHFHSDSVHFSSIPERFMCGVWTALEDINETQGPLEFYPRSHFLPIIKNEDIGYEINDKNRDTTTQEIYESEWRRLVRTHNFQKQLFVADKGSTLIWEANLLHGGSKQLDFSRTRWSIVTHYYFKDCQYYTPMLSNESKGEFHMRTPNTVYPSPKGNSAVEFDASEYLRANVDVKRSGIDPRIHWQQYGIHEPGRRLNYKKELGSFNDNGYIVIKSSLELSIVDRALEAIKQFKNEHKDIWDRNCDKNGMIRRITNLHRWSHDIQSLFTKNSAARFCDYAFEDPTSVYTSLFFEAGSEQPIHRDTPYFHTRPINKFFGFWVALENVTLRNGPLQLIPKGHKSSELDLEIIGREVYPDLNQINPNCDKIWNIYQDKMHKQCIEEGLVTVQIEMDKGDTLVWHPMLPHGGSPMLDPYSSRNSIVFHVTPENTPVYHQDAFFNPYKDLSEHPSWPYAQLDGRQVALIGNTVQFPGYFNGKRDEIVL